MPDAVTTQARLFLPAVFQHHHMAHLWCYSNTRWWHSTCLHTFHVPACLAHLPCLMPPSLYLPSSSAVRSMTHCISVPSLGGKGQYDHEPAMFHPCQHICLCLLFPGTHLGSLGTHVWMWDMSQCWRIVAQAHYVLAPPLGGTSTSICLPAVPCNVFYHATEWALLFAHLLCPSNLEV